MSKKENISLNCSSTKIIHTKLRVNAHGFDLRQAYVVKANGSAVGFGVAGIGDRLVYNVPDGATRRALLFLHHMRNKTGGP